MIVITGAAGFIASNLVQALNERKYTDLVLVDDFSAEEKQLNYIHKKYKTLVERSKLIEWLSENQRMVQFVFHIGARTDTAEFNVEVFNKLNLDYSKKVWNTCMEFGIPLIYASSAATYGSGELGYSDDHSIIPELKPLNPYGESKNNFDKWVLEQEKKPLFWAGFKFFNVYGPNEYHKKRMASVIFHAFNQIKKTGKMKLFRSHRPDFKDGEQLRDFVYVKDLVDVLIFFMERRKDPGIYNLGTGKAQSFNELVNQTFLALGKSPLIEYIDTPVDIRDKYQYFTEADISKLRKTGYAKKFKSLAEAVPDYVQNYLIPGKYA